MAIDSEALDTLEAYVQDTYGDHVLSTKTASEYPDFYELEIKVAGDTQEDAATITIEGMAPAIRGHEAFDSTKHVETVVPEGDDGDQFVYTVFVRERM